MLRAKEVVNRLGSVPARARRRVGRALAPAPERRPLVVEGFAHRRTSAPLIEALDDEDLTTLNELLPWKSFTIDSRDRRLGDWAWEGKRTKPHVIPDPRIVALDERFGLHDKHVLEVGCFEGAHTIGLCQLAKGVTAVDTHIANVVKTMVRCGFYGCQPTVLQCNVEAWDDQIDSLRADVIHHVGVLYHLREPVRHLVELAPMARVGLLLDTHVADPDGPLEVGVHDGVEYRYSHYDEHGARGRVFSGLYDESRWLLLDHIVALLRQGGFVDVEVVNERVERNGRRVTIYAGKTARTTAAEPAT